MQYGMQFDYPKQGDHRIQEGGVEVLVDAESANHLVGSTVDFTDGLSGVGFKISNPNAVRSCGCGTSFEVSREA
jgi:iron-sulfur cluster assembly protein